MELEFQGRYIATSVAMEECNQQEDALETDPLHWKWYWRDTTRQKYTKKEVGNFPRKAMYPPLLPIPRM